jgi:hypothetical protein
VLRRPTALKAVILESNNRDASAEDQPSYRYVILKHSHFLIHNERIYYRLLRSTNDDVGRECLSVSGASTMQCILIVAKIT